MNGTIKHIALLAAALLAVTCLYAQEPQNAAQPLMPGETPKPTKYVAVEEEKEHLVFFQGFTLSVDAYGPIAYAVSDYGTAEGALRLNLKNTFFPIIEAGYGKCTKDDFNTKVKYQVSAPFGRVGIDINLLRNKFQANRLYVGARYGLSVFKYDMSGPPMTDPYWGGSEAFSKKGISCTSHWAEFVFGVQVKIFKNFHMGWAVRYKREISSTKSDFAKPSCIPGYGYTTDDTCWGGTYSLIFDLNWGMKKSHKRGVNIDIRDIPQPDNKIQQTEQDNKNEEKEGEIDNEERNEERTGNLGAEQSADERGEE